MALIPIPNDWDGVSWCCSVIEWPSSDQWRAILLGQLTAPLRGRFWDGRSGTIVDAQAVGLEIYERNILGGQMAGCLEDLGAQLAAIELAIRQSSCCPGGDGPGYIEDGEGGFFYGAEEPVTEPSIFGPGQEFPDQATFDAHRCLVANRIIEGLIVTLNNASLLTAASFAVGVGVALTVFNPPLGIFVALAVAGFVFAGLNTLANHINDNKEDWICALYKAHGYRSALSAIDDVLDAAIAALGYGAFGDELRELFHSMLATDVINSLYEAASLPPALNDYVDCDPCVVCGPIWDFASDGQGWAEYENPSLPACCTINHSYDGAEPGLFVEVIKATGCSAPSGDEESGYSAPLGDLGQQIETGDTLRVAGRVQEIERGGTTPAGAKCVARFEFSDATSGAVSIRDVATGTFDESVSLDAYAGKSIDEIRVVFAHGTSVTTAFYTEHCWLSLVELSAC